MSSVLWHLRKGPEIKSFPVYFKTTTFKTCRSPAPLTLTKYKPLAQGSPAEFFPYQAVWNH